MTPVETPAGLVCAVRRLLWLAGTDENGAMAAFDTLSTQVEPRLLGEAVRFVTAEYLEAEHA